MASEEPSQKLRLPMTCDPPSEENPSQPAVWLIFGATGHLGRSLVRSAIAHGDKVTAVGRLFESTMEQMQGWHPNCQGLLCDVRLRDTVELVVKESVQHWGNVDIVAICTGYGVIAAAEDQSEQDLQNQFENNFFGTLHILQLTLPYFRKNDIAGRYIIFSSTAGALGVPGLSGFCATKYAVEGLVESMLYEVHCFGIRATLVEPGHTRDDDEEKDIDEATAAARGKKQRSSTTTSAGPRVTRYSHFSVKQTPSRPYASPTSPASHAKRVFQWLDTRQPTSARRVVELVWQLGHCSYPPLRLVLGSYAVESIRDRLKCVTEEIEEWKFLSLPAAEGTQEGSEKGSTSMGRVAHEAAGDVEMGDEDSGSRDGSVIE